MLKSSNNNNKKNNTQKKPTTKLFQGDTFRSSAFSKKPKTTLPKTTITPKLLIFKKNLGFGRVLNFPVSRKTCQSFLFPN